MKKGNITVTVAIFLMAFIVFCAFGVDTGFVTLNRYKLQRATETTALACAAAYKTTRENNCEPYFKLFSSKYGSVQNAVIEEVKIKEIDQDNFALKISTQMSSPLYFLRFAGVEGITLKASSYAKTYPIEMQNQNFKQTITLEKKITDKEGSEINVISDKGYFIFAGVDSKDGIIWEDIGCKASASIKVSIQDNAFYAVCDKESEFDLSKECSPDDAINVSYAAYLKFYPADAYCTGTAALPALPEATLPQATDTFSIKILNNVKLIPSSEFLE